ncbi:MAG: hypothetical protein J7M26_01970 [Armatimonadetes bacterium]|nr:hypothetical protein [Armatimonadota bacterium]
MFAAAYVFLLGWVGWVATAPGLPPAALITHAAVLAPAGGGERGDVNSDGFPDWFDLLPFCQAWRQAVAGSPWPQAADLDGDERLTGPDAALFLQAALRGPAVTYRLYGLCFSPFLHGDPGQGANPTEHEVEYLLRGVAPYCERVRTFGATKAPGLVPRLAHQKGLGVAAACWLCGDHAADQQELNALLDLVDQGLVDLAIIGTETLYRHDLTSSQLIGYLQQAKSHGVPVTTNDTWNELLHHPEVMAECDVIMANFYPYWEGVSVERAVWALNAHYDELSEAAGGKQVIVGEAGWPSAGQTEGDAVPSPENAALFFLNFVSWARARHVSYYFFEAFDEQYKAQHEGEVGAHWGLWTADPRLKPGMAAVFRGETMADNWTNNPLPGEPGVQFDYVPPIGSHDDLRGHVTGVDPLRYRLAVYIYVGGWWNKPTWAAPLTEIDLKGHWTCDITTGGNDPQATRIAAFLVPKDFTPPSLSGDPNLPNSLYQNSVAHRIVDR